MFSTDMTRQICKELLLILASKTSNFQKPGNWLQLTKCTNRCHGSPAHRESRVMGQWGLCTVPVASRCVVYCFALIFIWPLGSWLCFPLSPANFLLGDYLRGSDSDLQIYKTTFWSECGFDGTCTSTNAPASVVWVGGCVKTNNDVRT